MYIVDRIEDNIVVLECDNKNMINVSIQYFDTIPKEGNVYNYNGSLFIRDINKENIRREKISNLFNKLKNW